MTRETATENRDDPAVVATLVANHRRFLAFLERRLGSRADAEDVLQAAFVRGLERAGEIRDEERAVAWFYRMLRNAIVDHWRSRAAATRASQELARQPEPAEAELTGELCRCFEALLPTLPPDYARVLKRVDLDGARPVDVAVEEGVSANNAMVRLHRARRALRERLLESCRSCAEHGCLDCSCGNRRPV
jgi:RNA polymerase sigma-70 factor (ECF subfamily)